MSRCPDTGARSAPCRDHAFLLGVGATGHGFKPEATTDPPLTGRRLEPRLGYADLVNACRPLIVRRCTSKLPGQITLGGLLIVVVSGLMACSDSSKADSPSLPPVSRQPIRAGEALVPGQLITQDEAQTPGVQQAPVTDVLLQGMHAQARRYATGMLVSTPMFRGMLSNGESQEFQAMLQPMRCFKLIGVGGPTVTDLDLMLFAPSGSLLQKDTANDSFPVLGTDQPLCPTSPGAYRVRVRMYRGAGEFAVQIFHTR